MPTIIRVGKLRIAIYLNDHGPARVHVMGVGGEAKLKLGMRGRKPRLVINNGMTQADLAVALRVVDAEGSLFGLGCKHPGKTMGDRRAPPE